MSSLFTDWENQGHYFEGSHQLFYIDFNSKSEKVILVLHGYPTSSFDYYHVINLLSSEYRVVIPDLLGFGLSAKPAGHPYMLSDQADLISELLESLTIHEVNIIAHDYGTSVFTEMLARQESGTLPFAVRHATLCNGSMLIHLSKLRPIQRMLKNPLSGPIVAFLSNENTFQNNMKKIWGNPSLYNADHMKIHWQLLVYRNGKKRLPAITRYINQRYTFYDRWIGALKTTGIPIHILWAEKDPVAVIDMAYQLTKIIKNHHLTTIPDCGHYPMIELPKLWTELVLSQLNTD